MGEGSSGLEGEPGLTVKAVGGGVVEGSGVEQDELDLGVVVGVMLVWVGALLACEPPPRALV